MSEFARSRLALFTAFRYCWLVDPALGTFEVFERTEAGYTQVVAVTEGLIATVPGCNGLTIDVDALWSELARLRPT
jgi:hypothetical protein